MNIIALYLMLIFLYGIVESTWKRIGNTIEYNFKIPANTSALFHLPFLGKKIKSVIESGIAVYKNGQLIPTDGIELIENNDKEGVVSLAAGRYHFVVEYE